MFSLGIIFRTFFLEQR